MYVPMAGGAAAAAGGLAAGLGALLARVYVAERVERGRRRSEMEGGRGDVGKTKTKGTTETNGVAA